MSPSSGRSRSVRRRTPRAATVAIASLAAAAVAVPSAAHAAQAPIRFIGVGTDGQRSDQFSPVAVSNDGTEVLGNFITYPVIRDVKSGVTHDILQRDDILQGASADLKRIIFTTRRSLVPGDTNDLTDLYLWDRGSDTYALVSKDREGKSLITSDTKRIEQIAISNLGTGVVFTLRDGDLFVDPDTDASELTLYRYEASRSYTQPAATFTGAGASVLAQSSTIGDNGTTLVAGDQVIAPTASYTVKPRPGQVVTSPDGQFVAWGKPDGGLIGIDTANGNTATLEIPASIRPYAGVIGIANGASSVTVGGEIEFNTRYAFAHLDQRGGVRQIGGDIPLTAELPISLKPGPRVVLSKNEQFAASGLVLAKLGSTPLPGTEPVLAPNAAAFDYVYANDFVCPSGYKGLAKRPQLELTKYPQRSDLRKPSKATAKVWKDGSATISNDFTIYPGQKKDLYVGIEGGYRVDTKVTFADGSSVSGTKHYASHDKWTCIGL